MELKNFIEKNKIIVIAFLLMGVAALASRCSQTQVTDSAPEVKLESIDTMIPRGFILVPLELENLDHVSSLIGDSGVVDLYTGGNEKRRLIASRVKIIQAPYNSQVYAALIRESEGITLQNYPGPFRATVQNPKQMGSMVRKENRSNFSITYQR